MHTYVVGGKSDIGWFPYIYTLISKIVAHSSVPAFFFISGYLFFYGTQFTKQSWLEKLKRRVRSLLVPYLFWLTLWLVAYYLFYHTSLAGVLHLHTEETVHYTPQYILASYWCAHGHHAYETFPLVGQFWFIRDLMVIVLLSPLVWFLLKKVSLPFLFLAGSFWLFDGHFPILGLDWNIPLVGPLGLSHSVVFFFSLGAWFAVNGKLFTEEIWKTRRIVFSVYPILVGVTLWFASTRGADWPRFLAYPFCEATCEQHDIDTFWGHRLTVFFGIFFFINLVYWLLREGKIKTNAFLASASFFVFAFHQEWLRLPAKKIFLDWLNPQTDILRLFCYVGHFLFYVFGSLIIYYILRKIFPRFTALITGGR